MHPYDWDFRFFKTLTFISFYFFVGCSSSMVESLAPLPCEAGAVQALEDKDPQKAQSLLISCLGTFYEENYGKAISSDLLEESHQLLVEAYQALPQTDLSHNRVSLLATTKAQIHGIDFLQLALKMAQSSGASQTFTGIFPILPEANESNLMGLQQAIAILHSMESLRVSDTYKEAIFLFASISLNLKSLDIEGKGSLTSENLKNLDSESALRILSQIALAAEALSSAMPESTSAKKMKDLQEQIESSPGSSPEERLKSFLIL